MNKIPYTKPYLTVDQQIRLLESRHISFNNRPEAERFLTYQNYYYISGYIYYFEKKSEDRTHELLRSLDFEEVIHLVHFDQKLRELFFEAIQSVEIAVRTTICDALAEEAGPFCYQDHQLFKDFKKYASFLKVIDSAVYQKKKEPFITHFSKKYDCAYPPFWVIVEILTLGTISKLYENLQTALQKEAAKKLHVDHSVLVSWLKALSELRNVCAHHSRLWNNVFVNFPKVRTVDKGFPILEKGRSRLGAFIPMILHLLETIGENPDWERSVLQLFSENKSISPRDLGLEEWWK